MSEMLKKIIAGAVAGFAAALVIDINAWSKGPEGSKFNWLLAAKRWVAGAVTGATGAFGLGQVI